MTVTAPADRRQPSGADRQGRAFVSLMPQPVDSFRKVPRLSLVDRALISSTALLGLIFLMLIVTPVTVSAPVRGSELVILGLALLAMLALNVIRVRRVLAPLRKLTAEMEQVDLRHPERSRIGGSDESRELATFTQAFNTMLDRLTEERRLSARTALLAQERERRRVARALHDEAGQTLTAVALEIERAASRGSGEDRERLEALSRELHRTLEEIRRIARELRPEALDDLGLINALIALSSRAARQSQVRIERRLSDDLPPLSEELELVIYRVAQEALTNVMRHAEASECLLALAEEGDDVLLTVADNGRGMPADAAESIGIEGMRERALLVGGILEISSEAGAGTTVQLRAPSEVG